MLVVGRSRNMLAAGIAVREAAAAASERLSSLIVGTLACVLQCM
jgi:hypothetical protein